MDCLLSLAEICEGDGLQSSRRESALHRGRTQLRELADESRSAAAKMSEADRAASASMSRISMRGIRCDP